VRLIGLDILRAVAILLVLGAHQPPPTVEAAGPFLSALAGTWGQGGWIGVDLFFVLSGFLVSGLLFQEYQRTGTVELRRFLIRRAFKIWPPFYVVLFASLLIFDPAITWRLIATETLFLQNYIPAVTMATWSLAVEEHFYLSLAALVWWLLRRYRFQPFRWIPPIWLAVAVACLAMRIAIRDQPYTDMTHIFPTHLRIDGLLFGVLLSYGWHFGRLEEWTLRHRRALIVVGLLAVAPAFMFVRTETPWIWSYGLTLFYLGSGALLLGVLACDIPSTRLTRALATIGTYSYSIYLWHVVMLVLVGTVLQSWPVYTVVYVALSIGVGMAMAKSVEVPSLAVRDRYFPRVRRRASPARPAPEPALTCPPGSIRPT
jgi:peptidoglycan/LPS O-acetylase OafA/YrhL